MTFPNWRIAPHQTRNAKQAARERKLVSARELGPDFMPNRAQRRDYVRINQNRHNRKFLVGFGAWKRHKERDYESHALLTAPQDPILGGVTRRTFRKERVAEAKAHRKAGQRLRKLQEGK